MNTIFKTNSFFKKAVLPLSMGVLLFVGNFTADAQLAFYSFTGTCNCPNQNPFVTAQPANAVFSSFTAVNTTCDGQQDVFQAKDINTSNSIDSSQYFTFNITPNSGYNFKLD